MTHFFKLIRIQNLLIVAATQYLMRFAIIQPILSVYNYQTAEGEFKFVLQMSELDFFILVFATVCLTAAGYVINDYFDTKTDSLNRPKKVVVGRKISRRSAMALHIVLNAIGVIGGFYASWKVGHPKFGFIFVLAAGILWYYSTTYKRQFLVGNVIVALLTAMVPLMVILFEMPVLNKAYSDFLLANDLTFNAIFNWVLAFSFFAFVTTLLREIVKDVEDFEGDSAYGRNTLPIVMGVFYTKITVLVITVGTLAGLTYIYYNYLRGYNLVFWYFIIGVILPFILLIIKLILAKDKKDYRIASGLIKIIMLLGILFSLVAAYIYMYKY
ncbi:MAG: geranylgeranylglycerol-phosphate geranylgeranyltransferase [Bacteroidales bacterium]|nr:geranylgeranylglycerol-phosphate geranylgeranyltransferase [Bacteroidales bacterium]